MNNPENNPAKFHLAEEQRRSVARGVARYATHREQVEAEQEEANNNQLPLTTAGAQVKFADGSSQVWALNPSLGLTAENAPWLPEVVRLMEQGDVATVVGIDVPVENM